MNTIAFRTAFAVSMASLCDEPLRPTEAWERITLRKGEDFRLDSVLSSNLVERFPRNGRFAKSPNQAAH